MGKLGGVAVLHGTGGGGIGIGIAPVSDGDCEGSPVAVLPSNTGSSLLHETTARADKHNVVYIFLSFMSSINVKIISGGYAAMDKWIK